MRSAMVTGATGFIGSKLTARLLENGWRVHAIVRPESETMGLPVHPNFVLHRHDGTTQNLTAIMASAQPDAVFHLASLFLADHRADQIEPLVQSNVVFPTQLFEAMTAAGVRMLVNTGTAWQHHEGEAYRPVNLYAATKQALQDILAYYTDARAISAITLKLFDTYGTGDPRRKLIRILGDAVRSGETLNMSPGAQIVDLTHVDDVVDAFLIAVEQLFVVPAGTNKAYFVSGERHDLRALVTLVREVTGAPLAVNFGGRPYREREVMEPVVPRHDTRLPGWTATRSLRDTLPNLLHLA